MVPIPYPLSPIPYPLSPTLLHNLPVRSIAFKDITIEGYSRAAVQTYWRIPEYKLGFDLGAQPWSFMGTPLWFVSHTHMDHLVALPVYVARRRMMKMEPPTIYLPEHAIEPVQKNLEILQPPGPRPAAVQFGADPCRGRDRDFAGARGYDLGNGPHGAVVRFRRFGSAARSSSRSISAWRAKKIRDMKLSGIEITTEMRIRASRVPGRQFARRP